MRAERMKSALENLADVRPTVARLELILGSRDLAKFLGVSRAVLKTFLSGGEAFSGEASRRAIDLDHVLARAALIMKGSTTLKWLGGRSIAFYGARPIDVLRDEGAGPVLDELSRIASGSYA